MKKNVIAFLGAGLMLVLAACNSTPSASTETATSSADSLLPQAANYKTDVAGKETALFYLKNSGGATAAVTSFGARLVGLTVPDKNGKLVNVVLGMDSASAYKKGSWWYFGATIGRYGNRIAKGKFSVDGTAYTLDINNAPNSLHGGKDGFWGKVWDAKQVSDSVVEFKYTSKDMEAGYPGTLNTTVTYTLGTENALNIAYSATTDKAGPVNLTNHAYFNLNGEGSGSINDHLLTINSDAITAVDSTLIPTGERMPVAGTPFDFNTATAIGARIDSPHVQLKRGIGYDHNYILKDSSKTLHQAATVYGPSTGIFMEVLTTEPGVQFYGGNFMTDTDHDGIKGKAYPYRTGLCLETQHFPDSPNQPSFPSTILKPGETYSTNTTYKFSVK